MITIRFLISVAIILSVLSCNETEYIDESATTDTLEENNDSLFDETTDWKILEEDNYSIKYPEDWDLDTTRRLGTVFVLFADSTDQITEDINMMIFDMDGKNFAEFIEVSEKEIERPEIRTLIESIALNENGMRGHKFVFVSDEEKTDLKVVQYCFLKGDSVYGLTFMCEQEQFNNYIEIADKIMNRFRLNKTKNNRSHGQCNQ